MFGQHKGCGMSKWSLLQFDQAGGQISAEYNGRRLNQRSAAVIYEMLRRTAPDGNVSQSILRIDRRDEQVEIDLYRRAADKVGFSVYRTIRGNEASTCHRALCRSGEDATLPIVVDVTFRSASSQAAELPTHRRQA